MALRLREFRERAGLTLEQVAERLGMSHSQISRIERGASDFSGKTLKALADLYGVQMAELIATPAPGNAEPIEIPAASKKIKMVPIVGYVGGGAEVIFPDGWDVSPIDEVEVVGAGADVEAVIVRGDSMSPSYRDRDIIVYRRAQYAARDLLGEECVVRLADGRTFVKELQPGSEPALFTLVSRNPAVPPITDVALEWAVPVAQRITRWRLR
jgi:transcriptional regulator with XRE-family HTH domain